MILKGKDVAESVNSEILTSTEPCYADNIVPTVAIIRVGENPGDIAYENGAIKKAKSLGLMPEKYTCPADFSEDDLIDVINICNNKKDIHGILLLQPLPSYMDADRVRNNIAPEKDIDGITDINLGNVFIGKDGFAPCTAESCMEILKHYNIELVGKKAVVIGRSLVIGKPVAMMLMKENATVTMCHTKTPHEDLVKYCREADIIVTAAGHRNTLTKEMVREGQTVIDVGINFNEEGKMCGDAAYDEICDIVENITPVPGGVGSVTTSILMKHLVKSASECIGKNSIKPAVNSDPFSNIQPLPEFPGF